MRAHPQASQQPVGGRRVVEPGRDHCEARRLGGRRARVRRRIDRHAVAPLQVRRAGASFSASPGSSVSTIMRVRPDELVAAVPAQPLAHRFGRERERAGGIREVRHLDRHPAETSEHAPYARWVAETEVYDLRVTVERIEGRSVCGLAVGDYFEVTESSRVRIPEGKHFASTP